MIQEINVKTKANPTFDNPDLEEFRRLIKKADNPIQLNYLNATNTDEMIDDIF